MAKIKKRLDQLVLDRYPTISRTFAQSLIMQGRVMVDDNVVTKAGTLYAQEASITVDFKEPKFVSRAGYKLEKALDHFQLTVEGLVVLDAGLSTGGFTDCLLQRGVSKVYGVDVGYGQVHEKIRHNPRVIVMEKTNLRHLPPLPEEVDLVTLDLSFISVLKVMEVVKSILKKDGCLMVLIKPQFEAERHQISKGGIVKDPMTHQAIVKRVIEGIQEHGLTCQGVIESPILGTEGNKEFLAVFH